MFRSITSAARRGASGLALPLLLALAACSSSQPTAPAARAPTPPASREALPVVVRELLDPSMQRHGETMETLLWGAIMIDYETTASFSRWLADEPHIARPGTAPASINEAMPTRFFDLQDAMFDAADALTAAAQRHDDLAMGAAFGRLAQTCITCHSAYMRRGADDTGQVHR
jgi:hypothetical protein